MLSSDWSSDVCSSDLAEIGCALQQIRLRRTCRIGGGGGGPQFIGGKAPRRLLQHLLLVAGREIKQSSAIDPRGTRRLRQLLRRLERARGGRPPAQAAPRPVKLGRASCREEVCQD